MQCGGIVNKKLRKVYCWVCEWIFLVGEYLAKLQARAWLSHAFARLANTLIKDEESARDNHILASNFAKYSPI